MYYSSKSDSVQIEKSEITRRTVDRSFMIASCEELIHPPMNLEDFKVETRTDASSRMTHTYLKVTWDTKPCHQCMFREFLRLNSARHGDPCICSDPGISAGWRCLLSFHKFNRESIRDQIAESSNGYVDERAQVEFQDYFDRHYGEYMTRKIYQEINQERIASSHLSVPVSTEAAITADDLEKKSLCFERALWDFARLTANSLWFDLSTDQAKLTEMWPISGELFYDHNNDRVLKTNLTNREYQLEELDIKSAVMEVHKREIKYKYSYGEDDHITDFWVDGRLSHMEDTPKRLNELGISFGSQYLAPILPDNLESLQKEQEKERSEKLSVAMTPWGHRTMGPTRETLSL